MPPVFLVATVARAIADTEEMVGIIGAMIGGFLISPLVGAGTINQNDFSIAALVVSFIGAVILLAIVNLVRRGRIR